MKEKMEKTCYRFCKFILVLDEVNSKTTLKYLNADDVMIGKTIYGIVVVLNPMLSTDHVSKRS